MYELPITVEVFDRIYQIRKNGDYRLIATIIAACEDLDFTDEERAVTALTLFYDGVDTYEDVLNEFDTIELQQEALKQIMNFISCGQDNNMGLKVNYKLIDWQQDEKLIVAAINPMLGSGQDIRFIEYMHWWTFISYYMGIGESALHTVTTIRSKIIKGKKLEDYEKQFKRDNPEYFKWRNNKSQEEMQFENDIMDLWKK